MLLASSLFLAEPLTALDVSSASESTLPATKFSFSPTSVSDLLKWFSLVTTSSEAFETEWVEVWMEFPLASVADVAFTIYVFSCVNAWLTLFCFVFQTVYLSVN